MQSKLSVEEIKAVAETAISAKTAVATAKAALDADPENQTLKSALTTAEAAATDAQTKADALSQSSQLSPKQISKMLRKKAIIEKTLQDAGVAADDEDDEDDEDDDLEDEDLDKPLTRRDLNRIDKAKASKTAVQMAEAIPDVLARDAVKQALSRVVASGDPEKDFQDAVAIASREKNSKVLEELRRKPTAPQHRSGSGAPARQEGAAFEPTSEEAKFMRPPFNLTEKDIIKARGTQA